MRHEGTKARRHEGAGFTLMELVIVLIVLALLMAMTLPRVLGRQGRVFQLAVDSVADLMTMYAQRESLSARPEAIWHDRDRNRIVLMTLAADDARPGEPDRWRPDRTVKPVQLPANVDPQRGVGATIDGTPVDISQWPITTEPGKRRPRIELSLYADDGREATLVLSPDALKPYEIGDVDAVVAARQPIDLDAAGRAREDW